MATHLNPRKLEEHGFSTAVRSSTASYFSSATALPSCSLLSSAWPFACESPERKQERMFLKPEERAKGSLSTYLLAWEQLPQPTSTPTRPAHPPNPPSPSDRHTPQQKPARSAVLPPSLPTPPAPRRERHSHRAHSPQTVPVALPAWQGPQPWHLAISFRSFQC